MTFAKFTLKNIHEYSICNLVFSIHEQMLQGEEILSQASTVANTTAAEEEEEEEDAGGGEESEEEESDVVRGEGGLVNNHINYN